ncbi:MAG: response regulator transcription factor [Rhodanobacteraceae bacterium]|nr:response regulator transcription factor [Rhodanobacteraceae bacterium]
MSLCDPQRLRVALADDQSLVREALSMLLDGMPGLSVVTSASSGMDLLDQIRHIATDVVIIDVRMPGLSGFDTVKKMRAEGLNIPVVLLTTFNEADHLGRAIRCGAQALLLKGVSPKEMYAALHTVRNGGRVFPAKPAVSEVSTARGNPAADAIALSAREQAILRLAASGCSNKEIGHDLNLSVGTVRNYLSVLFAKLGVRDRTQAVMFALSADLL